MRRTDGPFPVWEIIPGQLYQRGKLHGYDISTKLAGLRHYGISTLAALAPTHPDPDFAAAHFYTHFPIPDGLFRKTARVQEIASELVDEIRDGRAVLTMCNAGRNRSGLLSSLVIMELSGLPPAAAIHLVQRERPNALANEHFITFLEGLS